MAMAYVTTPAAGRWATDRALAGRRAGRADARDGESYEGNHLIERVADTRRRPAGVGCRSWEVAMVVPSGAPSASHRLLLTIVLVIVGLLALVVGGALAYRARRHRGLAAVAADPSTG